MPRHEGREVLRDSGEVTFHPAQIRRAVNCSAGALILEELTL